MGNENKQTHQVYGVFLIEDQPLSFVIKRKIVVIKFLRLTIRNFQFLRLTANFLAVLWLTVNLIKTLGETRGWVWCGI